MGGAFRACSPSGTEQTWGLRPHDPPGPLCVGGSLVWPSMSSVADRESAEFVGGASFRGGLVEREGSGATQAWYSRIGTAVDEFVGRGLALFSRMRARVPAAKGPRGFSPVALSPPLDVSFFDV